MPIELGTDSYMELQSGARYVPNKTMNWRITDIAHALSNLCRFGGHSRHFYSVAEHSVLCSLLADDLGYCDPFEALMHDAHESVISDMPAPWKPHLPDYQKAEKKAEADLREFYGLSEILSKGCKHVDYLALYIEAYFLMPSKGEDWVDPLGIRVEALKLIKHHGWHLTGMDPTQAKAAFLRRFKDVETEPLRL